MKYRNVLFLRLLVIIPLYLVATPMLAQSAIEGQWRVNMPYGELDELVFNLHCEGGKLTGEVKRGSKGTEELSQGVCEGKQFEFQVKTGRDTWLWSGELIEDEKLRCHRQKQGKRLRQTYVAVR